MTWGIVRPKVLLPAEASAWSEERRRLVLTHEIGHAARFDAFTQAVAQVALALAWFHPLAWLAVRRLAEERERACDDLVLRSGTRASRYAGELVALARAAVFEPPRPAAAMARASELEARLLALLDPGIERGAMTAKAALALGISLLVVLPLAAAQPVARRLAESGVLPAATAPRAEGETPPSARKRADGTTERPSAAATPPLSPLRSTRAGATETAPALPAPVGSARGSLDGSTPLPRLTNTAGSRGLDPLGGTLGSPAGSLGRLGGSLGSLDGRPGALSSRLSPLRGSLSPPPGSTH
jgi:hypothetical protein